MYIIVVTSCNKVIPYVLGVYPDANPAVKRLKQGYDKKLKIWHELNTYSYDFSDIGGVDLWTQHVSEYGKLMRSSEDKHKNKYNDTLSKITGLLGEYGFDLDDVLQLKSYEIQDLDLDYEHVITYRFAANESDHIKTKNDHCTEGCLDYLAHIVRTNKESADIVKLLGSIHVL